jgi:hypothetical protein
MHFLPKDQAKILEKKLRRQLTEQSKPKLILYYNSGDRDYAKAAKAISEAGGNFSEVRVLFLFCVTGDGWTEGNATHRGWSRYREWRSARGELRRLYDVPGHSFARHDVAQLTEVFECALELGWDALVSATPGRQLLFLSHDDRMEIYRGFDRRRLADRLTALGYWHR